EDGGDVLLDRLGRDVQLGGGGPVGETLGELLQDFGLARVEIVDGELVAALDQGVHDARVEDGLPGAHLVQCVEHGVEVGEPCVEQVGDSRCASPKQFQRE